MSDPAIPSQDPPVPVSPKRELETPADFYRRQHDRLSLIKRDVDDARTALERSGVEESLYRLNEVSRIAAEVATDVRAWRDGGRDEE